MTSGGWLLHAHRGPSLDGSPHEVRIQTTTAERERLTLLRDDPEAEPIVVDDLTTGERWAVSPAPCGGGCHCAAVAVPLA